jgi:hypothetical protein
MTAFVFGCGESGPKLVPVAGVVTLNGKPLEGAVVSFHPDPSNKEGKPGEDITGPEGNYKVNTNGRSGLVPGKYHVSVTKLSVDSSKVSEAFKDDPFMAQLSTSGPEVGRDAQKKTKPKDQIEGAFDREIPPEGGEQNFDVRGSASAK